MRKETCKSDIGFTDIVKRYFEQDEDIDLTCRVFVRSLATSIIALSDDAIASIGKGFLIDQFILFIQINPDSADSLIDDIFDLSFKSIDFESIFQGYLLNEMFLIVDEWMELDEKAFRSRIRNFIKQKPEFSDVVFTECINRYSKCRLWKQRRLELAIESVIEEMNS